MAMTRQQLRVAAAQARYEAGRNKPPTRKQAVAWLAPIRNALDEIQTGEVDSHRGYPITKIRYADEDFARIDHAINGFLSLIHRLMPELDTRCMSSVANKLANGILLTLEEIDICRKLLADVEDLLLTFTRAQLKDAANTEMIKIEFERMGMVEA